MSHCVIFSAVRYIRAFRIINKFYAVNYTEVTHFSNLFWLKRKTSHLALERSPCRISACTEILVDIFGPSRPTTG